MDRNKYVVQCRKMMGVALRKESVDRNPAPKYHRILLRRSLSARRAWIEISGVDFAEDWLNASLSARRAWIEIVLLVNGDVRSSCRSPQGERG